MFKNVQSKKSNTNRWGIKTLFLQPKQYIHGSNKENTKQALCKTK